MRSYVIYIYVYILKMYVHTCMHTAAHMAVHCCSTSLVLNTVTAVTVCVRVCVLQFVKRLLSAHGDGTAMPVSTYLSSSKAILFTSIIHQYSIGNL
jgi:hypothetical protein